MRLTNRHRAPTQASLLALALALLATGSLIVVALVGGRTSGFGVDRAAPTPRTGDGVAAAPLTLPPAQGNPEAEGTGIFGPATTEVLPTTTESAPDAGSTTTAPPPPPSEPLAPPLVARADPTGPRTDPEDDEDEPEPGRAGPGRAHKARSADAGYKARGKWRGSGTKERRAKERRSAGRKTAPPVRPAAYAKPRPQPAKSKASPRRGPSPSRGKGGKKR